MLQKILTLYKLHRPRNGQENTAMHGAINRTSCYEVLLMFHRTKFLKNLKFNTEEKEKWI